MGKNHESKVYWVVHDGNFLNAHPEYILEEKVIINPSFNDKRLNFDRGSIMKDWPDGVSIYVSGSKPVDLLLCSPYIDIVSDRARQIFQELAPGEIEFLPVQVYQTNGRPFEAMQYWAIHVLTVLDALAWDETVWVTPVPPQRDDPTAFMSIIKPVFYENKLGNHKVFRFEVNGQVRSGWYVTKDVKEALVKEKCFIGIEFYPVKTIE